MGRTFSLNSGTGCHAIAQPAPGFQTLVVTVLRECWRYAVAPGAGGRCTGLFSMLSSYRDAQCRDCSTLHTSQNQTGKGSRFLTAFDWMTTTAPNSLE